MATFLLSVPPDGSYNHEFRLISQGTPWAFRMTYNERTDQWALSTGRNAGAFAVKGVPIVTTSDLLAPYKARNVPPGRIDVIPVRDDFRDPGLQNLGERVQLTYTEP